MTRLITLIGLCLTLLSTDVFACDCDYQGPFLKMAQRTNFVALVKVTKYLTFREVDNTPLSMDVEIIDVYKGKENRKRIKVWGDNGVLCRPYLSTFKEGQYYVIAFNSGDLGGQPGEIKSDYYISDCGEYWLTVGFNNEKATGDIDSKNRTVSSISLTKLKSTLKNNGR